MPTYRAISGPELKQIILSKLEQEMTNSGKFRDYLTYPNLQFWFNLQVHLPVMADRDFGLQVRVEEDLLPPDVEAETLSFEHRVEESPDLPPDLIRHQEGLPVVVEVVEKDKRGNIQIVERVKPPQAKSKGGKK